MRLFRFGHGILLTTFHFPFNRQTCDFVIGETETFIRRQTQLFNLVLCNVALRIEAGVQDLHRKQNSF